jgi:hypothetical protein
LAAFNLDLLGTPFALVTALDIGGQVAIADLSRGMVQNLLRDVTSSLEFNLSTPLTRLTADLHAATAEVNKIADSMHPPSDTASGANDTPQSAAGPAAPGEPTATNLSHTSANRTPIGSLAPSAIGPLIGNTAILGLQVGIAPLEAVTSLTNAQAGLQWIWALANSKRPRRSQPANYVGTSYASNQTLPTISRPSAPTSRS